MAERNPHRKRPLQQGPQRKATRANRAPDSSVTARHEWTLRAASSLDAQPARETSAPVAWELVAPQAALEREEDLAEVVSMLAAGEVDVARDELLWLLDGCHEFLNAHRLLGELALGEDDLPLARAHFGYAFQLGQRAIERAGGPRPVPYRLAANEPFHESAKGLVWCLLQLKMPVVAAEVVEFLVACDPSDPLGLRKLLAGASDPPPISKPLP